MCTPLHIGQWPRPHIVLAMRDRGHHELSVCMCHYTSAWSCLGNTPTPHSITHSHRSLSPLQHNKTSLYTEINTSTCNCRMPGVETTRVTA